MVLHYALSPAARANAAGSAQSGSAVTSATATAAATSSSSSSSSSKQSAPSAINPHKSKLTSNHDDDGIRIQVINRDPTKYTNTQKDELLRHYYNKNPLMHPHERAREYIRAVNATKLERIFSKPFLFASSLHKDTVTSIALLPNSLTDAVTASADGEVVYWDMQNRMHQLRIPNAHAGNIRGVVTTNDSTSILSCGHDQTIKLWNIDQCKATQKQQVYTGANTLSGLQMSATQQWLGNTAFNAIDTYNGSDSSSSATQFVSAGNQVDVWDLQRSEPTHSFSWGCDTINTVKCSHTDSNIIASTASDRNIVIYDLRSHLPVRKIVMKMQTNALSWNPQEPYIFATANEDTNAYSFDMRRLDHATHIFEDHVSAVMALDYSPTGKELVTGSYDKTIRMYNTQSGHSRDVYHTKRMQRLFAVKYTLDNKYILSGSDDANLRLWKSHANAKLAEPLGRERDALNYQRHLKEKFAHAPEISRISRHRHLPKAIYTARALKHIQRESQQRKASRQRAHTKPEKQEPYVNAKQKSVLMQQQ